MAKLYVECGSNATAARRLWINRYHDQTFGAQCCTVNRIQIFAEKNGHGSKSFLVCILKSRPIFCTTQLQSNNYCFSKNLYSVGFVTLL